MTEQELTLKLGRLATALLNDLDAIAAPKWSQVWEQQAVQLVADAFEQAAKLHRATGNITSIKFTPTDRG